MRFRGHSGFNRETSKIVCRNQIISNPKNCIFVFMKPLYIFLIFSIFIALFCIPVKAGSFVQTSSPVQSYTYVVPNPLKIKIKDIKKLKKTKKVQSNQTAGIIIFIIGCMILLLGLGITIVAITDAIITIGLGVLALGLIIMCIGDIIGNLGLINLIFNICDCLSVLL
jgi:hypothetical protein